MPIMKLASKDPVERRTFSPVERFIIGGLQEKRADNDIVTELVQSYRMQLSDAVSLVLSVKMAQVEVSQELEQAADAIRGMIESAYPNADVSVFYSAEGFGSVPTAYVQADPASIQDMMSNDAWIIVYDHFNYQDPMEPNAPQELMYYTMTGEGLEVWGYNHPDEPVPNEISEAIKTWAPDQSMALGKKRADTFDDKMLDILNRAGLTPISVSHASAGDDIFFVIIMATEDEARQVATYFEEAGYGDVVVEQDTGPSGYWTVAADIPVSEVEARKTADIQPIKQDLGADIYYEGDRYKVYDVGQVQGYGSGFAVSEKGHGVVDIFDTPEEAVNRAEELEQESAGTQAKTMTAAKDLPVIGSYIEIDGGFFNYPVDFDRLDADKEIAIWPGEPLKIVETVDDHVILEASSGELVDFHIEDFHSHTRPWERETEASQKKRSKFQVTPRATWWLIPTETAEYIVQAKTLTEAKRLVRRADPVTFQDAVVIIEDYIAEENAFYAVGFIRDTLDLWKDPSNYGLLSEPAQALVDGVIAEEAGKQSQLQTEEPKFKEQLDYPGVTGETDEARIQGPFTTVAKAVDAAGPEAKPEILIARKRGIKRGKEISEAMTFEEAQAMAATVDDSVRFAFGTNLNKWYAIDETDRDWEVAIPAADFLSLSEQEAVDQYISPTLIR